MAAQTHGEPSDPTLEAEIDEYEENEVFTVTRSGRSIRAPVRYDDNDWEDDEADDADEDDCVMLTDDDEETEEDNGSDLESFICSDSEVSYLSVGSSEDEYLNSSDDEEEEDQEDGEEGEEGEYYEEGEEYYYDDGEDMDLD